MELNETQKNQLQLKGINQHQLQEQIENFKNGFPKAQLIAAARINEGIHLFDEEEEDFFVEVYRNLSAFYTRSKFVPASGAASRMFKHLFQAKEMEEKINEDAVYFLSKLKELPFYTELKEKINAAGFSIEHLLSEKKYATLLDFLLTNKGLNYGQLPKALILFHKNEERTTTAIEEQLFEAGLHLGNSEGNVRLHFTVSPEHSDLIEKLLNEKGGYYEQKFNCLYEIVLSNQSSSTDTIAVNMDNTPFEQNGKFLFRPGGHGALIHNLNQEETEIVFIKNIDNVAPESKAVKNSYYKELLGGVLIYSQNQIFDFLHRLEALRPIEEETFNQSTLKSELESFFNSFFQEHIELKNIEHARNILNRPLRICGMVKNEGEPGGGPFWVKIGDEIRLQIVESSEIDLEDSNQRKIFESSTHFNPVDIVCGLYDYKGNKYDLKDYCNYKAGFIAQKSVNGKEIKAQELPGLWNGAMAFWNTIFVEVPLETFNPVKTVNDLLKPNHKS